MPVEAGESGLDRVLFVDDDELVLDALRDALRPFRHRWSMRFVADVSQAMAALEQDRFDVVVSDLRMPGMDGAELLEAVRDRHPDAVRIVLSGHADMVMAARAAAVAHRMIAKPCATEDLARVIERSCAIHALKQRVERDLSAIGASALPAAPRLYAELVQVLADPASGAADVAGVVEQDVAIAAKLLQLANSSYFGRRSPVSGLSDAVAYLGMEAIRALVLQGSVIKQFTVVAQITGFELESLQRHSSLVARVAARIATDTGLPKETYTAGLLHDIGWLILAAEDPARLSQLLTASAEAKRPLHELERERHEVTHADIGAHLLALWGLPVGITEAIAGHHDAGWLRGGFDEVAAVRIADMLVAELEPDALSDRAPGAAPEEVRYLAEAGLEDRLPAWRTAARCAHDEASS